MSLKIAFLGTPNFSVPALREVHKTFGVNTVFSQPPKKSNRGMKNTKSPVQIAAEELNINVRTPINLNDDFDFFKKENFNIAVVSAYGQIISDLFLNLSNCLFINIHASILPKWRGAAPIQRSLMNMDQETGISIMKIKKELDSGPVLLSKSIPLSIYSKGGEIEEQLSYLGSELIIESLNQIQSKKYNFIEQDHSKATYAKKIVKEDEMIDWNLSAEEVIAKIHALNPRPGSFFEYQNTQLKIFKCELEKNHSGKPGEVILDQSRMIICCKSNSINVLEIQRPGKKKQQINEFLLGFKS